MGRRKIEIAPITDHRNRLVTFTKRKTGLFKKAFELGVLCGAEVAVIVFAHNQKVFEFSSTGSIDDTLIRYTNLTGPVTEKKGPSDYGHTGSLTNLESSTGTGRGTKRTRKNNDDDDDDEDEDEEEPVLDPEAGSSNASDPELRSRRRSNGMNNVSTTSQMASTGRSSDTVARQPTLPLPLPSTSTAMSNTTAQLLHGSQTFPSITNSAYNTALHNPLMFGMMNPHDPNNQQNFLSSLSNPSAAGAQLFALSQQLLASNSTIQAALAHQRMLGGVPGMNSLPLSGMHSQPLPSFDYSRFANLAHQQHQPQTGAQLASLPPIYGVQHQPQHQHNEGFGERMDPQGSGSSHQHQQNNSRRTSEMDPSTYTNNSEMHTGQNDTRDLDHFLQMQGLPFDQLSNSNQNGDGEQHHTHRSESPHNQDDTFTWPSYDSSSMKRDNEHLDESGGAKRARTD